MELLLHRFQKRPRAAGLLNASLAAPGPQPLAPPLPLASTGKEAGADPLGPDTRGSCWGKVRTEDGLLVTKAR